VIHVAPNVCVWFCQKKKQRKRGAFIAQRNLNRSLRKEFQLIEEVVLQDAEEGVEGVAVEEAGQVEEEVEVGPEKGTEIVPVTFFI